MGSIHTVMYDQTISFGSDGEITYGDVVSLVQWMVENHEEPANIAHAVEKPWKYMDEIAEAKRG